MPDARASGRARGRIFALSAAAAALLVAILVAGGVSRLFEPSVLNQLADLGPSRSIVPSTSLAVRYRPCAPVASDSMIARATCSGRDSVSGKVLELMAELERRRAEGQDEEAVRGLALINLHALTGGDPRADEAIELLDSALPLTRDSAVVLSDLAAAYLVRAAQDQSFADLIFALQYTDWALSLDPALPPALFNRAVALDALTADNLAAVAWRRFVRATASGETRRRLGYDAAAWRHEAELRAKALRLVAIEWPPLGAPEAELRAFARKHPQHARASGWYRLLPKWGEAVLTGNGARADTMLRQAEIYGVTLAGIGGDGSLAEQVRWLRALPAESPELKDAAEAHRLDGELYTALPELKLARTAALLDSLGAHRLSPAHRLAVRVQRARFLIDARRRNEAERLVNSLTATLDTVRYPSASADLAQFRGTLLAQDGEFGAAPAEYREAEARFARIGEAPSRGAAGASLADAERTSGNAGSAEAALLRAAVVLRPYGAGKVRHDYFRQAAMVAAHIGCERAMRDLAEEDVLVATQYGVPAFVAEARMSRGMLLAAGGDPRAAVAEAAAADSISAKARDSRPFLMMFGAYVRALAAVEERPEAALTLASAVIADRSMAMWPIRGFALRARAQVALGDTAGARTAIDTVFAALARGRAKKGGGAAERDVVEGDVRAAVQALVRMLAAAGRYRDALGLLERAEAAFSAVRIGGGTLPARVPDGRVLVRLTLLGDTLFAWTQAGERVTFTRVPLSRPRLRATLDSLKADFTNHWDAGARLSATYGMLIGPIERELGPPGTELAFVVSDPELAWLPMDALIGPDGKWLMMTHPVSRALSMAAAATRPPAAPDSAVFLAPVYPRESGLDTLPFARAEVDAISATYPTRTVLDSTITAEAFKHELPRYPLLHFAGHAQVDDRHPERSYLAVGGTRLYAQKIAALPLENVRLVVLSSCWSLAGGRGAAGFTGLSGAFLGAGAGGVVGSLWRVDDGAAMELMREFHRQLRSTGNAALALQRAKISLAVSGDPVRSSPATWAAFQLVVR